jgi:hypothetical protein
LERRCWRVEVRDAPDTDTAYPAGYWVGYPAQQAGF